MTIKSIVLAAAVVLAVGAVSLALTSCSGDYSVCLVTDQDEGSDDSFNQPALDGLDEAADIYGVKVSNKHTGEDENFTKIFNSISSKTDLVIGLGYKVQDDIVTAAEKYSQTNYVAIDCAFEDAPDNLIGIQYKTEESSFLVGYIAGMTTKAGKVGFIGGMEADTITPFEFGYKAGVLYAAKTLGTTIDVETMYIGSFSDQEKAENMADELYENGYDIIFQAAGSAGVGVITSAVKNNQYVIGVDVDQSYLAPENVLTSALKEIKLTVMDVINQYKSGAPYIGSTIYFGLKESGVGIPESNPLVDPDVLSRTYELKDLIISSAIVPPANEEEYNAFVEELAAK